jgi:hypothetical protein
MPVPDSSGDWAGWLQSLLANQGAAQPYGPGAAPTYGTLPGGTMPGGQVMGRTATTPGQLSMGYPAIGQAAGRPSVAPGTQTPGAPDYGPGSQRAALNQTLNPTGSPQAYPPWPTPPAPGSPGFNMPPVNSAQFGGDTGGYSPDVTAPTGAPLGQGGIGSDARIPLAPTPMGQGGIGSDYAASARPVRGPLAAPAGSAAGPVDPSIIARKKMMMSPAATSTSAPAAAPNANQRFGTFQYQTPNSSASRAPIYTALNLGGGGPPAANPNVPAANAQPVASAAAPNVPSNAPSNYGPLQQGNNIWDILSKAPWNYGPLQQNNIWGGSGGPQR